VVDLPGAGRFAFVGCWMKLVGRLRSLSRFTAIQNGLLTPPIPQATITELIKAVIM
jgi:hypothetical protein